MVISLRGPRTRCKRQRATKATQDAHRRNSQLARFAVRKAEPHNPSPLITYITRVDRIAGVRTWIGRDSMMASPWTPSQMNASRILPPQCGGDRQLWDLRPISAHAHRMLNSAHFTRLGSRTPEPREQCAAALIL
jgi:hypothetical protein